MLPGLSGCENTANHVPEQITDEAAPVYFDCEPDARQLSHMSSIYGDAVRRAVATVTLPDEGRPPEAF